MSTTTLGFVDVLAALSPVTGSPRYAGEALAARAGRFDVEAITAVLHRPHALIADIGCGAGWSTCALAFTFPDAELEGWDPDAAAIDLARRHASEAGLEERVVLSAADATRLRTGAYDAIFAFEQLVDPDATVVEIHRALRQDGIAIILDPRANDQVNAAGKV